MLLWNLTELMHLTRQDLCALAETIEQSLPGLEPGTVDRFVSPNEPDEYPTCHAAAQFSLLTLRSWPCRSFRRGSASVRLMPYSGDAGNRERAAHDRRL